MLHTGTIGKIEATYGTGSYTPLTFFTSGAERMRIDTSGNVGIGTTAPSELVHLKKTTGYQLRLEGSGSNKWHVSAGWSGYYENSFLIADTNAGPRLTIADNGNVGIGTSSPDGILDIEGNFETSKALVLTNTKGTGTVSYVRSHGGNGETLALYHDGALRQTWDSNGSATFESGGTEHARIDSSGNLLVGTTSYNDNVAGIGLSADNYFYVVRQLNVANQSRVATFNRKGADGSILDFAKDGTVVGTIGNVGSIMYIGKSDTTIAFDETADAVKPRGTAGAQRDGAINLGTAGNRWNNLFLGGGVYLGGTGAANKLDDVESGNWTPVFNNFSATGTTTNAGLYFKVGKLVYVELNLDLSSPSYTGSGSGTYITGLPFAVSGQLVASLGASTLLNTAAIFMDNNGGGGNVFFKNSIFTIGGQATVSFMNNSGRLRFSATYYSTA